MNLDSMLTTHFSELAEEPAPDSVLDMDRVIVRGRRRMAGRRILHATVGATSVVLAATLVVSVGGLLPGGTHATAAPLGGGMPTTNGTGIAATLTGSDPYTEGLTFGWMPAGFSVDGGLTDPGNSQVEAHDVATGDGVGLSLIDDSTGGLGIDQIPGSPPPPARLGQLGGTVNGRQAHWAYDQFGPSAPGKGTSESLTLSWLVRGSLWGEVSYYSNSKLPDGVAGTLRHMADTVGETTVDVALPFHLPGAPTALPVMDVEYGGLNQSQTAWTVSLYFGNLSCGYVGGSDCLVMSVVASGNKTLGDTPAAPDSGGRHVTVTGGAGLVYTEAGGSMIKVNANGLQISITALGIGNTYVNQHGGILAYYNSIIWLGTDTSKWTTHVIG